MSPPRIPLRTRFWASIGPIGGEGCLLWEGTKAMNGYGVIRSGGGNAAEGKQLLAHRLMWEAIKGPIPQGMCVLHRCDNPPCVRPSHLFLGTKGDNRRDCAAKGRSWKHTHCKRGHPLIEANIVRDARGARKGCRECNRIRCREWSHRTTFLEEVK
jgi:hypothetical protein